MQRVTRSAIARAGSHLLDGASLVLVLVLALVFGFGSGCSGASIEPAAPPNEGGASDAGLQTDVSAPAVDATSPCPPGEPSGSVPFWAPPTRSFQGVCTRSDVALLMTCAFVVEAANCDATLAPGFDACRACLMTGGAGPYGPMIIDDGFARLNVAGCVWNADPAARTGDCVEQWADRQACAASACLSCRSRGVQVHDGCITEARVSSCAHYTNLGVDRCFTDLVHPTAPAAFCNPSSDFMANAIAYGQLFCGQRPLDAGTDAPDGD